MEKNVSEVSRVFSSRFGPDLISELEENSVFMRVKAGQTIIDIGQPIKMVILIMDGTFKATRMNERGQELLLYYLSEGDICSLLFTCATMDHPSVVKGTAEDDGALLLVPIAVADEWMVKYPTWKTYVMTTVLNRFDEVIKAFDDVSFKKMDDRLITYLKRKSKITGSSLIYLTHQQIADELGTNRVVISRLLKKLENDERLLLFRNQIKLLKNL